MIGSLLLAELLITRQAVFNGFVTGMVYGMVAFGIVLIYRSTKVINFAVGNMGLPGAALFSLMVIEYGFPFWVALPLALAVGMLFALVIELGVIRRLFDSPRVIVLVATIGVAQLSFAIAFAYPNVNGGARYPMPFRRTFTDFLGLGVRARPEQVLILVVVPVMAALLSWFLYRTTLGLTVKASASNPDVARLSGVNPKLVSTMVWVIAGLVSTVSIMLLMAGGGSGPASFSSIGAATMAKALAAAVLAAMTSFSVALAAGVALGVVLSLLGINYNQVPGIGDILIFGVVVVALFFQSRGSEDASSFSFVPKIRPVPESLRRFWWVRNIERISMLGLLVVAIIVGLSVDRSSRLLLYATIFAFAICAASLLVVTGWAGQLSLAQMAFAGIGALLLFSLTTGMKFQYFGLDIEFVKWPYLAALFFVPVITAILAAIVGVAALRIRGLLLAVISFTFAIAAEKYIFRLDLLNGGSSSSVIIRRGDLHVPRWLWDTSAGRVVWDPIVIDMTSQRATYFLTLAVLVAVLAMLSRLRRSGVGRRTIAVRDNPEAAAAYTVATTRTKLTGFALAGGIAGLGGALLGAILRQVSFNEPLFLVGDSLNLVAMLVIGGIGSVSGPLLGALWVEGLPKLFSGNALIPLVTSSVGLLVLLLYFPGGLVQLGYSLRDAVLRFAESRLGDDAPVSTIVVPPSIRRGDRPAHPAGTAALEATDIRVNFGGNQAVAGAAISVQPGEVVGLIGTNGAGKSTLMNAIGGFVPSTGSVSLFGQDLTGKRPDGRARLGLGRTFQAATLFPELTVRETVLVALEARGRTGLLSTALFAPWAGKAERQRRSEAAELIDFLGLGRYADLHISELSTGTRRIVELAGLLALDARMLCLDEPTAGVAQRETEAFGPLMLRIREELDASMLIIEHDMPLIMALSDRVYCLERGAVIAEGDPDTVRHDPLVVASYLGTDDRAIARSDA